MKYPSLVPLKMCKTPIEIEINSEGLDEEGAPIVVFREELKCNYQDSAKTVYTESKKQVALSGIALFHGDINPEMPILSGGKAVIFGEERTIYQGFKHRNPDGTVNYTELRLL